MEEDKAKYFLYLIKIASISSAGEGKEMLEAKNMSIHYEIKCSTSKSKGLSRVSRLVKETFL